MPSRPLAPKSRCGWLTALDTGQTPAGSSFSATVEETVRLDKKTVLTKGTTLKGTVTDVVSSG